MARRVGIDLVSVEEVARSLAGPLRDRYLGRIYTDLEIDDCRTPAGIDPARLAARFAAKEAVLKILSTGDDGLSMRDIEVRAEPSGRVGLALHGRAAEQAAAMGLVDLALALTHEPGYGAAVAMGDGPDPVG